MFLVRTQKAELCPVSMLGFYSLHSFSVWSVKWKYVYREALSTLKCQWKLLVTSNIYFLKTRGIFSTLLIELVWEKNTAINFGSNSATSLTHGGVFFFLNTFRSTIVHRFLIKATIEERMQTMLKTVDRRYVLIFFLDAIIALKMKRWLSTILLLWLRMYILYIISTVLQTVLRNSFKTFKVLTWFQ